MTKTRKYSTVESVVDKVQELSDIAEAQLAEKDMYVRIMEGNTKLNDILNYSITPVLSCTYKTTLCTIGCYAVKDYKMNRLNVAKSHIANYKMSLRDDFVEVMIQAIEKQLARKKYQGKHVTFRIHVSGDFYNYEYFTKWIAITDHFKNRNISFGCYTKSIVFIRSYMKQNNRTLDSLNINFMSSIWSDTKQKYIDLTNELGLNVFTAYDSKTQELPEGYLPCADDTEKGSCGTKCNLCYEKDSQKLLDDKWTAILDQAFGRKKIAIAIH
jgi:Gene product 88